jgi:glutamine amidotransferase-like uncharacterized protein
MDVQDMCIVNVVSITVEPIDRDPWGKYSRTIVINGGAAITLLASTHDALLMQGDADYEEVLP